jgi:ATP-dependent RNA helicase RhlE
MDPGDRRPEPPRPAPVRALVLTPTRELAAQVQESVDTYGQHLPLRSAVIFGGVKINPQIAQLRRGVDILVATPGRLLDHAGQGTLDLSRSRSWCWTRPTGCSTWASSTTSAACWRCCRTERQNLLFSATFSDEIKPSPTGC